ncbi:CocE/NonD family hydrolase [Ideonella sp. DXS29W]|uniref:CocE/NonD family hydrolase n=1 Tax=Ideonella lacteola TaxID=2984193 RepID=A0ABU9BNQ8_9BURK
MPKIYGRPVAALVMCLPLLSSLTSEAASCRAPTPAEAAIYTTPILMPGVISPKDGTCFLNNFTVATSDGVRLTANVFLPSGANGGSKFPAVVYPSSWAAADFFEYLGEQQRMAQNGYVAMAYTARGFYGSGGVVGVASEQDTADFSSVLDWLVSNTATDANRIGAAGISYGAGLSMLGAARDSRVKAVASMSGWSNLIDQMYGNSVPNPTWLAVLTLSGTFTGNMDPIIYQYDAAIRDPDTSPEKIAEISAWGVPRSPLNVVDTLNARKVPVLVSKNYQDDMFSPNSTLLMFSRLTGPKKLLLQPGIHGSAELAGATLGVDNPVFDQVHRWMDRWLKGVQNGVDTEPKVNLQLKFGGNRETLSNWPAPELRSNTYYLGPRGNLRWDFGCFCWKGVTGTLSSSPNRQNVGDQIDSLLDTTATTGLIPILSPIMESVGLPVINHMATILSGNGIRYEGDALNAPLKLRGSPKLQLRAKPNLKRGMLVAYLYDVDWAGFGTLITHGARAVHWATPGAVTDFSFDMNAVAYDVPAGHHLVLVFDTADSLYGSPVHFGDMFRMALPFDSGNQMSMTLPVR